MDVILQLAAVRRSRGIEQKQVAEAIGRSQATVSLWECGAQYPTVPLLAAWAATLGVKIGLAPADGEAPPTENWTYVVRTPLGRQGDVVAAIGAVSWAEVESASPARERSGGTP